LILCWTKAVSLARGIEAPSSRASSAYLHERDERRHDDSKTRQALEGELISVLPCEPRSAITHQSWELIAQRLSSSRGHETEHVGAVDEQAVDDLWAVTKGVSYPASAAVEHGPSEPRSALSSFSKDAATLTLSCTPRNASKPQTSCSTNPAISIKAEGSSVAILLLRAAAGS
jgi:hypothetical protein